MISKESVIPHFSDITQEILKIIIKQNIDKYSIINCELSNYNLYLKFFSQIILLEKQLLNLDKEGKIFVFNTALFGGIDYFGKEKFEEYNSVNLSIKKEVLEI